MIEHRQTEQTATVTMPLNEYDYLKMVSIKYSIITNTLFEHAYYYDKEDDLYFTYASEEYVRVVLKVLEPDRYEVRQEELKQKHEGQAKEDF